MKVFLSKAIRVNGKNWKLACDSTNSQYYPLVFYSHAHSDHIPRRIPKTDIIISPTTKVLLRNFVRNFEEGNFYETYSIDDAEFKQKSSGHIVGSTALIIESSEGKLVYTGDVSSRDKGFLEPFSPEKCDILIIESTFGSPDYIFPKYDDVIKQAQEQISDYLENNIPVVLMGYALGKAQMLYNAFSHLSENIIMHGSNFKINSLLLDEKVKGAIPAQAYLEAKESKFLDQKNEWILYAPLKSGRDFFFSYLKKKYDVKLFAFTGWAISDNYNYRMSVDHSYPISDHADYTELMDICKKSNPDQIYTIYGYTTRFAAELRRQGFNAIPLSKQTILDSFF
jgi:putative mRNA 3-end processing factor